MVFVCARIPQEFCHWEWLKRHIPSAHSPSPARKHELRDSMSSGRFFSSLLDELACSTMASKSFIPWHFQLLSINEVACRKRPSWWMEQIKPQFLLNYPPCIVQKVSNCSSLLQLLIFFKLLARTKNLDDKNWYVKVQNVLNEQNFCSKSSSLTVIAYFTAGKKISKYLWKLNANFKAIKNA